MASKLSNAYVDPSQPRSFTGINAFAKAQGISRAKAKGQLQQLLSYTLHKPRRPRFPTLLTMVFATNEQFVMDLVNLQILAKWNQGYKYLLTVIDVLSKYAWVEPLKSKSAAALVDALEKLWARLGSRQTQNVQNAGGEFYNAKVQAFFRKQGVNHFSTHGDPHGSVVERWNRTLKTKMYRYFTAKNTLKYIDVLLTLVKTYNHTVHSSIKEKPVNVTTKNEHEIWYRLYGKRNDTHVEKNQMSSRG